MKQIKQLKDIPFGYMVTKNRCDKCAYVQNCSYEHLGLCFYLKNEKDRVDADEEPKEE